MKLPAASPPAISAIKIGGRAAGGTFGRECACYCGSDAKVKNRAYCFSIMDKNLATEKTATFKILWYTLLWYTLDITHMNV